MAVLGEGASGTTYRARDVGSSNGSGFDVAIKELAFHRVDTFQGPRALRARSGGVVPASGV
ncbi:MAG: hypothetical protein ACOC9J_01225 [Persicimonas sp.]